MARLALACSLLLVLGMGCADSEPQRPSGDARPANLLLITVDTLRADRLGAYGYALDTSPAVDSLAARGVRFADATVQFPKTWPQIASMLTGKYPDSNGVRLLPRRALPQYNVTLAEALAGAGYRTAAVVANANLGRIFQYDQGFGSFVESWKDEYLRQTDDRSDRLPDAKPFPNAEVKRFTNATVVTDQALALLDQLAKHPPFFLWLHYIDPHGPYEPPAPYDELFVDDHPKITVPASVIPSYQQLTKDGSDEVSTDLGFYRAQYDGEIRRFDDQLARLLGGLESRALTKDTLVVLTADHGESLGEHTLFLEHGHGPYQPTASVPLIVAWEGHVPAGRVVDAPVGLIDLLPTLLELLEVPAPPGIEGQSLAPLVTAGMPAGAPEYVFMESGYRNPSQLAVRRGKWKLVHLRNPTDRKQFGAEYQLYDLSTDPAEQQNVLESNVRVGHELIEALRRWQQSLPRRPGGSEDEEKDVDLKGLDERSRDMLKGLGYIEDDAPSEAAGAGVAR